MTESAGSVGHKKMLKKRGLEGQIGECFDEPNVDPDMTLKLQLNGLDLGCLQ